MESRAFLKYANNMIKTIRSIDLKTTQEQKNQIQKDLTQLYSGLGNPSLPTAARLRDIATGAGFSIDSRVLGRIKQFDEITW